MDLKVHDLRMLGNLLLERVMALSQAINTELLEPMSKWLNDPKFMDRFAEEPVVPDWAGYKRAQRQWTRQQRILAGERLQKYRQEMVKSLKFRKELPNLFKKGSVRDFPQYFDQMAIGSWSQIFAPFSPIEQQRQETGREFRQAKTLSLSSLLPWRVMLFDEMLGKDRVGFDEIKSYLAEDRNEKIAKFQYLLQMDSDGDVCLEQAEHNGLITIKICATHPISKILIKDQQGRAYEFDWLSLSEHQKNKVITDVLDHKIICRISGGESS
ncbi:MAG: hypothetical protein U5L00_07710 [Desulfovermiculus sp.]|nr:hypothetical protein [Desulfovermiculus sp.]